MVCTTRNSQDAAEFVPSVSELGHNSNGDASVLLAVLSAPAASSSSVATSQSVLAAAPASATQASNSSVAAVGAQPSGSSFPTTLDMQVKVLLASGLGFLLPDLTPSLSTQPGRSSVLVSSFVNTFSVPISSVNTAAKSLVAPSPVSSNVAGSSAAVSTMGLPTLQQHFLVRPGFLPIPWKLVSQIFSGCFVELSDLLSANFSRQEPEAQLLLHGHLIKTPKQNKCRIEDIATWMEAFSIYCLVLTS